MSDGFRQHSYQPPAGATEIILVRHGVPGGKHGKPFPLVDGHGDPKLHPNGEQQAVAVGEALKRRTLPPYTSHLYNALCKPLRRWQLT